MLPHCCHFLQWKLQDTVGFRAFLRFHEGSQAYPRRMHTCIADAIGWEAGWRLGMRNIRRLCETTVVLSGQATRWGARWRWCLRHRCGGRARSWPSASGACSRMARRAWATPRSRGTLMTHSAGAHSVSRTAPISFPTCAARGSPDTACEAEMPAHMPVLAASACTSHAATLRLPDRVCRNCRSVQCKACP